MPLYTRQPEQLHLGTLPRAPTRPLDHLIVGAGPRPYELQDDRRTDLSPNGEQHDPLMFIFETETK